MNYSYIGVSRRTFQQAIVHLLETEYGFINSPRVLAMLAEDIQQLAKQFFPADVSVHPGWLVFTGTKATGPKAHPARTAGDYTLVTISWPVLLPEDSLALAKMPSGRAGSVMPCSSDACSGLLNTVNNILKVPFCSPLPTWPSCWVVTTLRSASGLRNFAKNPANPC